jgi:hypothetical protein
VYFGLLTKSIIHIIDSFLKSIFVKGRSFKSISFKSRLSKSIFKKIDFQYRLQKKSILTVLVEKSIDLGTLVATDCFFWAILILSIK